MKFEKKTQAFALRLIGRRNHLGLSQSELAEKIGVSLRTIQNWEGEESVPQGIIMRKLSETLRLPIPFLLGETDSGEMENRRVDVLVESTRPYGDEEIVEIRRDCHDYLDRVLDSCGSNVGILHWTQEELKRRLLMQGPSQPPAPKSSSGLPSDFGERVERAHASRHKKGQGH